jgi:hypothetical protein
MTLVLLLERVYPKLSLFHKFGARSENGGEKCYVAVPMIHGINQAVGIV